LNRAGLLRRRESPFDSEGLLIYGPPRVADAPDRSGEPCMYRPKATEDHRGRELGGGRVTLFAGDFLRFNNKGTHETPRERCIVMQILGE
jgi:hypothetical protein